MQPVKVMPHDVATLPVAPASVRAARLGLARSHTALFPTRLALARWTAGGNLPHLAGSATPPLRAAWFARAQREFQSWLESGGFVQHDDPALDEDTATACEALPGRAARGSALPGCA